MLYYDFKSSELILISDNPKIEKTMSNAVVGLAFTEVTGKVFDLCNPRYLVVYRVRAETEKNQKGALEDINTILRGIGSGLFVSFVPANPEYIEEIKEKIEETISKREVRVTKSITEGFSSKFLGSTQAELYYDSDEKKILLSMLNMFDEAVMNNGISYKVGLILENGENEILMTYLKSKLFVIDSIKLNSRNIEELYGIVKIKDAIPFSYSNAADMISFPNQIRRVYTIKTTRIKDSGNIKLGAYLDESSEETDDIVKIDMSTLNLGTLITGMPGVGKTFTAMSIVSQVIENGVKSIVISPTREWAEFGFGNSLKVVKLYDSNARLNFFKCNQEINIERFYENLAMLMASASSAGPYRNSLEKCLLSAFRRVYSSTRNPDPVEVYECIEETIIEQHGKRSGISVKYTKHGENIRAALENLRLMLFKPQFAYKDGADFGDLLNRNVIFDLSSVSNNMKPLFYALILNQIYSFTDILDENGYDQLRVFMALEEAHLVFENNEQSAATFDLRQRIQDFRKKGIGLMLITHNTTNINGDIRRLCQTKIYFRQSADIAKYAAGDLIFNENEVYEIVNKLKTLGQRTCALNYISNRMGERIPAESIFIKIPEYKKQNTVFVEKRHKEKVCYKDTVIRIVDREDNPIENLKAELSYVGERILVGMTDHTGMLSTNRALEGKKHKLTLFGEKKRDTKTFVVNGGEISIIKIG